MLKNNSLLLIVYGVLFFLVLCAFFLSRFFSHTDQGVSFKYPELPIHLAGKTVPMQWQEWYDVRQRFDKEFLLTSNNLYQFFLYVKRYPLYIPYIETALREKWLPDDIKYLPIAESALRNDIISSAGAAWIWQFMPETAKRYGLRVDAYIDERYHFEKSSDAALVYLSELYEDFWDWALAFAAYNRWENGLKRDMQSQGVDNYYELYLNEETSRYVFRILAIKYVLQSYFEHKWVIDKLIGGTFISPLTQKIQLWETQDLRKWAHEHAYRYKDIKNLNRWIVWDSLPEGSWEIKVIKK